mmetsp:Transcript_1342/g.3624  ORF Transcript_1342/g.3624 Transcript_1342/m.3624 type:complete len:148 (-) Transcript_1342:65-508(-)
MWLALWRVQQLLTFIELVAWQLAPNMYLVAGDYITLSTCSRCFGPSMHSLDAPQGPRSGLLHMPGTGYRTKDGQDEMAQTAHTSMVSSRHGILIYLRAVGRTTRRRLRCAFGRLQRENPLCFQATHFMQPRLALQSARCTDRARSPA